MKKVNTLKSAGIDTVIIDNGKISEEVMKATDGKGADKCIELVGAPTMADSCASLGPDGILSMVGCVSDVWVAREFEPMTALAPRKVSV